MNLEELTKSEGCGCDADCTCKDETCACGGHCDCKNMPETNCDCVCKDKPKDETEELDLAA